MPKTDRAKSPAFLESPRAFYAEAFEHTRKKDLVATIEEWSDMEEGERRYTVAHLLYLNLKGQAAIVRLLGDVRELLDEVAEGNDDALAEPDEDDEPEDDTEGDGTSGGWDSAPAVEPSTTDATTLTDDQGGASLPEVA